MNQHGSKEMKLPSITSGELMMCDTHGLDYRISCEECQTKYKIFQRACELSRSSIVSNTSGVIEKDSGQGTVEV